MTQGHSYGSKTGYLGAGQGFLARMAQALANYRLYRATIEELRQLSDRDLNDLGLNRLSIRDIARESVYGG